MPLAGALDIGPLLAGAPEVRLDDREVRIDDVDILQVIYEVGASELEALVPPALNPTLPPVVSFLVYLAKDSVYGPFSLVQVRLSAHRPMALGVLLGIALFVITALGPHGVAPFIYYRF